MPNLSCCLHDFRSGVGQGSGPTKNCPESRLASQLHSSLDRPMRAERNWHVLSKGRGRCQKRAVRRFFFFFSQGEWDNASHITGGNAKAKFVYGKGGEVRSHRIDRTGGLLSLVILALESPNRCLDPICFRPQQGSENPILGASLVLLRTPQVLQPKTFPLFHTSFQKPHGQIAPNVRLPETNGWVKTNGTILG